MTNTSYDQLICIPITETSPDAFFAAMIEASGLAEIVELRLDYLSTKDCATVLTRLPAFIHETGYRNLLLTFRPREQGGQSDLNLSDRQNFWRNLPSEIIKAIRFADFELDLVKSLGEISPIPWEKVICSWHNFENTPNDLFARYDEMAATPAYAVKIATKANRITDSLKIFELIEYAKGKKPIIALAMSVAGVMTRILAPSRGSMLTYASLRSGAESASGQVPINDLKDLYRIWQIKRDTNIFGIIGNPVSHSRSPAIHNRALQSINYNGVYLPFEVTDVGEFMRDFVLPNTKKMDWKLSGLSVTIPHKITVMPYLDYIDLTAKAIGAVNTIAIANNGLIGYNTDVEGAMKPLEEIIELNRTRVAVIGAGGSARAICYGLSQRGALVTIFARNIQKAISLTKEFNVQLLPLNDFNGSFDILINCTPIGMLHHSNGDLVISPEKLKGIKLVYDLVYTPIETALLIRAKNHGCQTLSGLAMLAGQAAEQFRLWTGNSVSFSSLLNLE